MSVRRNTTNRLFLVRTCHTCGKEFSTTASSPWMRQLPVDGKKQKTCYFCSSACYKASYKHIGWYDGKAEQRRAEREAKRDIKEKNRRYYAAHAEQERERAKARYWANPDKYCAANVYNRKKRKLMEESI